MRSPVFRLMLPLMLQVDTADATEGRVDGVSACIASHVDDK